MMKDMKLEEAVRGVSLFKDNDPWHFANIPLAFESALPYCNWRGLDGPLVHQLYYGCAFYTDGIYTSPTARIRWRQDSGTAVSRQALLRAKWPGKTPAKWQCLRRNKQRKLKQKRAT